MLTDIQIAQAAKMLPITEIAKKLGIPKEDLELYGDFKAKIVITSYSIHYTKLYELAGDDDPAFFDRNDLRAERFHKALLVETVFYSLHISLASSASLAS